MNKNLYFVAINGRRGCEWEGYYLAMQVYQLLAANSDEALSRAIRIHKEVYPEYTITQYCVEEARIEKIKAIVESGLKEK